MPVRLIYRQQKERNMQLVKRTPEEIEYAFETFLEKVQAKINDHFINNYANLKAPTITVHPGRTYWKIVREEGEGLGINLSLIHI